MRKTVLLFGLLALATFLFIKLSSYTILQGNTTIEIILIAVALIFFLIGSYINKQIKPENETSASNIDVRKIKELEISKREYEVLKEIALGLSNKEIAEKLFLTESTIKTHVSNLLLKLNAKRRTQAIQIAKELYIL
ncbi:response regulator transcription factor [Maribacter sp. 4G9]|uniref:response regulator transcription factor n=1 Tax=Maribacter sp. 4G9 TaxID=1889777 RepID=UPI000C14D18D|nr:response regulator transcription factor [Maribacter sp. 4G9]PIB37924.1 helix-turn-helix transcriptional regulator [Maribacter sp. 4G9]